MIRFDRVVDGNALVRNGLGVLKLCDVYTRGDNLFIRHGGGFMQIGAKYDDRYLTANSKISVMELDCPGLQHDRFGRPILNAEGG